MKNMITKMTGAIPSLELNVPLNGNCLINNITEKATIKEEESGSEKM